MPDDLPSALEGHASYHEWLTSADGYDGQIRFHAFYPPRADEPAAPGGAYETLLRRLAIRPYRHQAQALAATAAGRNVVIATPTASGKSLAYQVPTLEAAQRGGTALYLFPTKALSSDQREKLDALAVSVGIAGAIGTYDGDTPPAERAAMREHARCILTNPDMLHHGILPHHGLWARFLTRLELLVLDELHTYRGVMGTHVANIVRRLLRVARLYGAEPRIVASSATIGNPAAHAANLTGESFDAVTIDHGPRAARELVFWRPPDLPGVEGGRRSANTEASDLAVRFVRAGLKSIFFCNSRKGAELLRRYAAGRLDDDEATRIGSYRAGYTPEDRRAIEASFKRGDLQVLTATSALELGVDVGGVDAVVMVGYPGSMTAFWQRAGRAGRRGRRALTLLVPGADPLDEYYLSHPDAVADGRAEHAVADPFNGELHPLHLACAAWEAPVHDDERNVLGPTDPAGAGLRRSGRTWYYDGRRPHARIAVRGSGGKRVVLRDGSGRRIGTSDYESALRDVHPGAVYLHAGESYLVRELDLESGVAVLLPHIEDYYTQPRSTTDIEILEADPPLPGVVPSPVRTGRVRVTAEVTSYVRKRLYREAVLDERPLDLPEVSYATQALWFPATHVAHAIAPADLPAALHALEHTLIGLLPAFVLCERADVGGVSYPVYPATGEPTVFIYDGYPGGVGYARAGAATFVAWLEAARDLLRDCPCPAGCPRCILSPKCGNGNQILDKRTARLLADALLESLHERTPSPLPA